MPTFFNSYWPRQDAPGYHALSGGRGACEAFQQILGALVATGQGAELEFKARLHAASIFKRCTADSDALMTAKLKGALKELKELEACAS